MPLSIPSKLLKGLPGEPQNPSKDSSFFSVSAAVREGVGSHSLLTSISSLRAACWRASLVAWCERNSALKSPRIPMRTASLTRLIVLEGWCGFAACLGSEVSTVVHARTRAWVPYPHGLMDGCEEDETYDGERQAAPNQQVASPV